MGASPVDIGARPLDRIVGIGQVMVDAGVSVELTALEIRRLPALLEGAFP
jgi:hypothetical protein